MWHSRCHNDCDIYTNCSRLWVATPRGKPCLENIKKKTKRCHGSRQIDRTKSSQCRNTFSLIHRPLCSPQFASRPSAALGHRPLCFKIIQVNQRVRIAEQFISSSNTGFILFMWKKKKRKSVKRCRFIWIRKDQKQIEKHGKPMWGFRAEHGASGNFLLTSTNYLTSWFLVYSDDDHLRSFSLQCVMICNDY